VLDPWKRHIVGRDTGLEITLSDPFVSRRHLALFAEANGWVAEDLGSTNGTFVNGSEVKRIRIDGPTVINLGNATGIALSIAPAGLGHDTASAGSSMTEEPRLHHFLIVDVVGSTGLWDTFPDAMHTNIRQLQRLTRSAVRNHNGSVFKTVGDGACSVFESAPDAVSAALELKAHLDDASWKGVDRIDVRLAVHTGLAARYGGDLLGQGVNEASKLCSLAGSDSVLVSVKSLDSIGESRASLDLGAERECVLPGVTHPVTVVEVTSARLK